MHDFCKPSLALRVLSARSLWNHPTWRSSCRVALAGTLVFLLAGQPVFAESGGSSKAIPLSSIEGQQRILHALNRFTFGPRPDEVAEVEKIGLKRWFDLQLNPSSIDDSALDVRLANYPAMQLSLAELESRYPSPQMVRGIAAGRLSLPQDPTVRILAQDEIAFYQMKREDKTDKESAGPMIATGDIDAYPHETFERLLAQSPGQRLQTILAMPPSEIFSLRQALRGPRLARLVEGMTPTQRETLIALGGSNRMIASEEMDTRILRDIYSQRQLEAVMTDFWLNHFNVYVRKNQNEPYLIPSFERTVRAHALGHFEDFLVATAQSPAMLEYLDNFRSIGPNSQAAERVDRARQRNPDGKLAKAASAGLNENYGRELMELHTLGVSGGYTQADVTEVAKVFTGWTIDRPGDPSEQRGEFQFDERRHEPGAKHVLGKTIHENGGKEGLEVLHMLATSPATAHFISQKLAMRFVSDDPPAALVNRMAATFLSTHGDIKSVLRTLFDSPEFWSSSVYRAKVKTPEEFVVSAARASNLQIDNPGALVQSLDKLGMPLYGMQTPNGYSWAKDGWVSTGALVSRMNFALVLSGDRLPGTYTNWSQLLGDPPAGQLQPAVSTPAAVKSPAEKESRLEQTLLGEPVSARTRATVLEQANDQIIGQQAATQFDLRAPAGKQGQSRAQQVEFGPNTFNRPPDDHTAAVMAGLLLGSPEFQRR